GTYLNRIIYVGEHYFKRDQQDELLDFYASTITAVDHSVALERLTGFLLIYTKYIVHLVELLTDIDINSDLENSGHRVWPISSDFIPYDVFSKPYECVTELPREKKSEEKKKEELEVTFEDAETEEQ
ncbi:hypothetical protein NQ318_006019, partial [Aromia moschata]